MKSFFIVLITEHDLGKPGNAETYPMRRNDGEDIATFGDAEAASTAAGIEMTQMEFAEGQYTWMVFEVQLPQQPKACAELSAAMESKDPLGDAFAKEVINLTGAKVSFPTCPFCKSHEIGFDLRAKKYDCADCNREWDVAGNEVKKA
jgi:hypothetical protein